MLVHIIMLDILIKLNITTSLENIISKKLDIFPINDN